ALSIAGVNGPRQTVISGGAAAAAALRARAAAAGRRGRRLAVSHAFHSAHMDAAIPAVEAAAAACAFGPIAIPFASTLDGAVHGPATVPGVGPRGAAYWARQLRGTVRFSDALAAMAAAGAETFLECGPGAVLCALGAGGVPGDGLVPSLRGGR